MVCGKRIAITLSVAAFVALGSNVTAKESQDTPAYQDIQPADAVDAVEVGEIVVQARRAGLPMWTVRRGEEGVLILVGNIREVPEGFRWRSEALESAIGRVDRVLYPQQGRATPMDIMRLLWRARTIVFLPEGGTLDQAISADDYRRLERLMANERDRDWMRYRPLIVAMNMVQKRAGDDDATDPDVEKVAKRAARKARVRTHHIGVVRGNELVDSLITSSPESQMPCLRAAMTAVEYGPNAMADRAEAWRRLDVRGVMANPFDRVTDECWPWGDPRVRTRMRTEWVNAISTAVADNGVTLAIAPVRTLGEDGGVLDQLVAAGFEIDGPEWK